jgi:hypothetical protein
MKTYVGIDYHKHYSYGVIMGQDRQVLRQGKLANDPRALVQFLGRYGGPGCAAVLEAQSTQRGERKTKRPASGATSAVRRARPGRAGRARAMAVRGSG